MTDNPKSQIGGRRTPIYCAASYGHTKIVKILAPLKDNPNAPNSWGQTPIHAAAIYGHTEIVKILAPFPKLHFISEFQSRVNDK